MSFLSCPCTAAIAGALLHRKPASTGNSEFVFTLKFNVEFSKWSEFEADAGCVCDKTAVIRDMVTHTSRFEPVPLKCSVFLDISTLKMRTLLSTEQELIAARNAIYAHVQNRDE